MLPLWTVGDSRTLHAESEHTYIVAISRGCRHDSSQREAESLVDTRLRIADDLMCSCLRDEVP